MRNVRFLSFKELGKSHTASLWLIDYSLNAAALPIALRLFSLSSQTASHVVYEACLHTSWGEKAYFYSPLPEGFGPKNSRISSGWIKLMKQHYTGRQEGTVFTFSPQQPQTTVAINILSIQYATPPLQRPQHSKPNLILAAKDQPRHAPWKEWKTDRQTQGPGSGFLDLAVTQLWPRCMSKKYTKACW